ncbi:hypothetical protein C3L33_13113, partial [Rhododendron williamsianum]
MVELFMGDVAEPSFKGASWEICPSLVLTFEAKNLIVFNGTWVKAMRVYNENPWLKALPNLKLDLDKMIVLGMKLKLMGCMDNLLDVYESMTKGGVL